MRAAWVFAGTMGLLILPKLLALFLVLIRSDTRRRFGGGLRTFGGVLLETVISALTAPVMMVFQSTAVIEILLGRDAGWQVQHRGDGAIPLREVVRRYALPTALGATMAVGAWLVSWPLLLWMTPVIVGLLLAIPVALLTTRASRSRPLLMTTPEQIDPPAILAQVHALADRLCPANQTTDPLSALRGDRRLRELHLAALAFHPPRRRGRIDPHLATARVLIDDAENYSEAAGWLGPREIRAVLGDRETLQRLLQLSGEHAQLAVGSEPSG